MEEKISGKKNVLSQERKRVVTDGEIGEDKGEPI